MNEPRTLAARVGRGRFTTVRAAAGFGVPPGERGGRNAPTHPMGARAATARDVSRPNGAST